MSDEKGIRGRTWGVLIAGLICLAAMTQGLQAAAKESGARVVVTMAPGSPPVRGELIGVRADAIVVQPKEGEARTVALQDIKTISVQRKKKVLLGIAIGALAGGSIVYALSYGAYHDEFLGGIAITGYSSAGAGVGGLIGGLTGASPGSKTYDLAAMSEAEINSLMAVLRNKARVRGYQ